MDLTIDSNVKNIIFNGNDVQKLVFNGVEVWSKAVEIYNNYGAKYLTFEFITSGTLTINRGDTSAMAKTLYYRKNGGSWTSTTAENYYTQRTINVSAGDIVECYATGAWAQNNTTNNVRFGGTAQFNLYGNIRSITDGIDFYTKAAGIAPYMFKVFSESKVVDASNCIIDYTTVSSNYYRGMFSGCYYLSKAPVVFGESDGNYSHAEMFYGCINLVEGPKLFSKTLKSYAYDSMFYNCSKLNYVEAYFTTTPGTNYTSNWMYGVQTTSGTFVKNSAATWNVTGVNGIPTNWTKTTNTYPTAFKIANCYNTYLSNIVASDNFTGTIFLSRDGSTWYGLKMSEMASQDAVTFWDAAVNTYWKNIFTDNGFTLGTGRSINRDWTNKGLSSTGADLYIMIEPGNDDAFMIIFGAAAGVNYTMSGSKYSLCTHCYQGATQFQPNSKVIFGDLMSSTPAYAVTVDKNY